MHNMKQTGITLMELAIVLTILGLLAGGVVLSRSLLRNSELVAVGSEYAKYVQAIGNFQTKYHALPGDFTGAVALWGLVSVDPGQCLTKNVGNNETCDGDGDGRITRYADYANTAYEQYRAWQHLGNAQMIDGNYSGVGGGAYDRVPGTNIPASKLTGAGWALVTLTTADIANEGVTEIVYNANDIKPNTLLWIGGRATGGTDLLMGNILTSAEASSLDLKMDDGHPQFGKIIAQKGALCNSASSYYTTDSTKTCALVFKTPY
jgi:hypothetical protein